MSSPVSRSAALAAAALAATGCLTALAAAPAQAAPAATAAARYLPSGGTLAPGQSLQDVASGQTLTMQTDGNVVVRDPSGKALWASGTRPAGKLFLQRCGVIFQTRDVTPCVTGDPASTLFSAYTSNDGRTAMTLQTDGNLVLRTTAGGFGSRVLWATYTHGALTGTVQSDGNFVLRNPSGAAIFATGTTVATWSDPRLTIGAVSLGGVRVGMTVAQAKAAAVTPLDVPTSPDCQVFSTKGDRPARSFVLDRANGHVVLLLTGNSGPVSDVTDKGVGANSTASQVLAAYGSAARRYTDPYGSFVILVRVGGHELRFDAFDGRNGRISEIQAGQPSVVERTELCG